ncbi:TonB family protein [Shewanella sp. MR-4]|uniref:energy transducer TonB n=1 Tax=Shewanella sp. (strain MR-4) TaxID=60480 RepID=UPI0000DE1CCA|nr:energy transducer TonB [Shewanella sp. MR-4]ABI40581.1 TonB family protein [Shewanella sp. MR-4]
MLQTLKKSFFIIVLTLCASNASSAQKNNNTIEYLDLTSEDKKELLNEYWITDKRVHPEYPIEAAKNGISGCVALVVGINSSGKPSGYKVKKSYPEGVFDNYATAALANWRWKATDKNSDKKPVLTIIQMDFSVSKSPKSAEAIAHCGQIHDA